MKGCGQTNIPETDNTQLPCEEFVSTDCVIYPEAILPFGIVENTDLTVIIKELVKRIRQNKLKISQLESIINNLDIEDPIKNRGVIRGVELPYFSDEQGRSFDTFNEIVGAERKIVDPEGKYNLESYNALIRVYLQNRMDNTNYSVRAYFEDLRLSIDTDGYIVNPTTSLLNKTNTYFDMLISFRSEDNRFFDIRLEVIQDKYEYNPDPLVLGFDMYPVGCEGQLPNDDDWDIASLDRYKSPNTIENGTLVKDRDEPYDGGGLRYRVREELSDGTKRVLPFDFILSSEGIVSDKRACN